ncbi:hypothetical protein Dda_6586 [Drechslerella dactyloides]|uniref:NADP-dependent oxidoreductase domain-containing protein n=1 Tax=Drechslerella dactyloides TaxID=74499 RepID=A0AAD6IUE8_DREDA|nr:hypothetical protein Dda_6586 [Drechslerella dactyloides]
MRFTSFLLTACAAILPAFGQAQYNRNAFTAPLGGDLVTAGLPFQVRWINIDGGIINLVLVRGSPNDLKTVNTIAAGISNTGEFIWNVPYTINAGQDYSIEIQSGAERNYTPLFSVINPYGPAGGNAPQITSTRAASTAPYTGPPTNLVEKTTDAGQILTESYPDDDATRTQTEIVESSTLIYPSPTAESTTSGSKIITLDASATYSMSTITYPTTMATIVDGSTTSIIGNATTTTSSLITPTAVLLGDFPSAAGRGPFPSSATAYASSFDEKVHTLEHIRLPYPAVKTTATTLHALQTGYRHVDTAEIYRNEHAVVAATARFLAANPSVSRSDIFVSTKLAPALTGYEAAKNAIAQSLSHFRTPLPTDDPRLSQPALRPDGVASTAWPGDPEFEKSKTAGDGLGYIDLYLIHAPSGTVAERNAEWKAMVEAQTRGEIKHLGVSNYGVRHLRELYEFIASEEAAGRDGGRVEVWQGETHPWLGRADIRRFCEEKGIVIQAYCPLVRGQRFGDPLLKGPKERTGKTEAQILIRWSLQMGFVPLPKSERNERIEENANVFDFELTPEEVKMIDTGKYEPCSWDPTVWTN